MRPVVIAAALALAAALVPLQQIGASRTALASVADPRGRALVDISADDFVIQEAGAPRDILSLRSADYPIVVLFDTAADAPEELVTLRQAVARFIDRIGQRPVAIGTLANPPQLLADFDAERDALLERLGRVTPRAKAGSVAMAGAALAGRLIQDSGGPMFSAIVLLSATPGDDGRNTPDDQLAPVVDSGAILHVIANRPIDTGGAPQTRSPLRALAAQTHGELTVIYATASYQAALDHLADRLNTEMMVEYLVPPGSKPVDVKVGVRIPGARVRGLGVAPR